MANKILNFTGTDLKKKQTFTDAKGIERKLDVYVPSNDLIKAVQLAYQVGRPLLIMGEPGCGKTRLAEAVAYELHKNKMYEHFFTWHIKSTTKAQDGLYQFDVLQRMYDANTQTEVGNMEKYIKYGELAKAFKATPNEDMPNILLIDEIDKADIDFPNDLLLELDKKMFVIPELENKEVKAQSNLLIIITSNQEKELPPAFLRRCLYYYIEFPKETKLEEIVLSHYPNLEKENTLFKQAMGKFIQIREDIDRKKPSTSELLDWFKMIEYYHSRKGKNDLSEIEKLLVAELEAFEADTNQVPYAQILYKTLESYPNRLNNG